MPVNSNKATQKDKDFEDEFAIARAYFSSHRNEIKYSRKMSGLNYSYIKQEKDGEISIIRLSHETLGAGNYGKIKKSSQEDQASVVKIQIVRSGNSLGNMQWEAAIALDLGIAKGEGLVRVNAKGERKFYQEMVHLGTPLTRVIPTLTFRHKLITSINLLIAVHRLHTGEASKSGTRYVHCDIKPNNIVLDQNGQVHLIDVGFASNNLTGPINRGTLEYLPITSSKLSHGNASYRDLKTNSRLLADKIASLRSIVYPEKNPPLGLFTQREFEALPDPIQLLLDTEHISSVNLDPNISERAIAATLICYLHGKTITVDYLENLLIDEKRQNDLITWHIQNNTPEALKQRLETGSLQFQHCFPQQKNNREFVQAALKKDPKLIQTIPDEMVIDLLHAGNVKLEQLSSAQLANTTIRNTITSCITKNIIRLDDYTDNMIIHLIKSKIITLIECPPIQQKNNDFLLALYQADPPSLGSDLVIKLLKEGALTLDKCSETDKQNPRIISEAFKTTVHEMKQEEEAPALVSPVVSLLSDEDRLSTGNTSLNSQ